MGASSAVEPLCTVPCFRALVRVLSFIIAAALTIISGSGFSYVDINADIGRAAEFACLSFLGLLFGITLFMAEFFFEWYFFYFGFLRYRVGRAVMYLIAGVLSVILGLSNSKGADLTIRQSQSFIILAIVGAACIGVGLIHLISIFIAGNNAAPPPKPKTGTTSSWFTSRRREPDEEQGVPLPPIQRPADTSGSTFARGFPFWKSSAKPATQPPEEVSIVPPAPVQSDVPPPPTRPKDQSMPSWMYR